MSKHAALIASLFAGLALAAAPSVAADMAKKGEMKKSAIHHAPHRKMSCYDYAWESQKQRDCLDKPAAEHKPAIHRAHHKMKKPTKPVPEKKS